MKSFGLKMSVVTIVEKKETASIITIAIFRKDAYFTDLEKPVLMVNIMIRAATATQTMIETRLAVMSLQSNAVPSSGGRKLVRKLPWM